MVTCSKCRQGRPCLSHTRIPFNGRLTVSPLDPHLAKYRYRIEKNIHGRQVRAFGPDGEPTYRKVLIQGMTLDEVSQFENGLSYLDWLSGQPWVYGEFRTRLTAYLNHPCIKRELEEQFPDPDDNSYQPLFLAQPITPGMIYSLPQGNLDKWHGNSQPKPERDTWQSEKMSVVQAWGLAADYLHLFETSEDPNSLLDLDFAELREVCRILPKESEAKLKDAYRAFRARLQVSPAAPVGSIYRFHFGVNLTKKGTLSKRGKTFAFLSDVLPITQPAY